MSEEQRYAYMAGFVEMGHFLLANSGRRAMGECLIGWFYTDNEGYDDLIGTLRNNRDKEVTTLVWLAMERHCGPDSGRRFGLVGRNVPKDGEGEYAFWSGNVEMAALLSGIDGKTERRDCVLDWFYRSEGEAIRTIDTAERKNPQVTLQQILEALIRMECGAP